MQSERKTVINWYYESDHKDKTAPGITSLLEFHKANRTGMNIGIHWYLTRTEYEVLKIQYSKRKLQKYGVGRRRAIS